MGAALARSSYNVLTADSATAALNVLCAKQHLDLVISEVVLPKMDGIELIENVKESMPAVAVMLTTADVGIPRAPSIPYLLKPFTAQTLVVRVKEVLERSQLAMHAVCDALEKSPGKFEGITAAGMEIRNAISRSQEMRWQSRMQSTRSRTTILLVESDAICRYAVSHYLWQQGFTVLDTATCTEAVVLWQEYRDRISLVLSAVHGGEAWALTRAVQSDCPEKPILRMTDGETSSPYTSLQKPFQLEDLLACIQRALR